MLLPFEDKITYDNLIQPYSVMLGPGIRADVNHSLRNAKEREGILTTLAGGAAPNADAVGIGARSAQLVKEYRKWQFRTGLSPKMVEQHATNIERLAGDYLQAQIPPRLLRDMQPIDVSGYLRTARLTPVAQRGLVTSLKRFIRFLDYTGRMDARTAYEFSDFMKQFKR